MKSITLFQLRLHQLTMQQVVDQILAWCNAPSHHCKIVMTPNLAMATLAHENPSIRTLLNAADLSLADGMPLVWMSRVFGKGLPERVCGSDVLDAVLACAHGMGRGVRIYLLGAGEGVAAKAGRNIEQKWSNATIVGTHSPSFRLAECDAESEHILALIQHAQPDIILLGLGFPKQEEWAIRFQKRLAARVLVCGGATIDFLAGHISRAPLWMQRSGLEWLYRLLREPRRLARRYAHAALMLPILVWRDMFYAREP